MSIHRLLRCGRLLLAALSSAAVLPFASPASAQITPQIVNGAQEMAEPTTGALIQGTPDSGHVVCSATLVGCDHAITSAHCFNQLPEEKNYLFFQHAGFVAIESATRHPAYVAAFPPNSPDFDVLRVEDIAFIKLAEPVSGIRPSTIVRFGPPADGTPGWIVGFGRDPITAASPASADKNAGIKRSGEMMLAPCEDSLVGEDVLCWHPPDPPEPLGPPGEDVSTCEGDSGGPLFVTEIGARVVAGVTKGAVYISAGQSDLCEPPVDPFDINLERHRTWIHGMNGYGGMVAATGAVPSGVKQCTPLDQLSELVSSGDLLGDCDPAPWATSPEPRTCGFSGLLDTSGQDSASHNFIVPAGTARLRVAWNGIASASASVDTNYYLRASAPASPAQFDCAATGTGTVGFCEFDDPVSGTWHTFVEQVVYQGEYQVTITLFGPPSSPPAVPLLDPTTRILMIGTMLTMSLLAVRGRAFWRSRAESRSRLH